MHANIVRDRSIETFSSHIWILTKLVVLKNPIDELLYYIVTACHRKIHRRLNNAISRKYFENLDQVESFKFKEVSREERSTKILAQRRNDQILLFSLSKLSINAEIPKLRELANKPVAEGEPYAIYTQDTYWEFHLLLCELLQSFRKALDNLTTSRDSQPTLDTLRSRIQPNKPKSTKGSLKFKIYLADVVKYGYALIRMVKGSGLLPYLQNLVEDMDFGTTDVANEQEERDVDLLAIQPGVLKRNGQPQSLLMSWRDWLGLILVHFEAVDTLVTFVRSTRTQNLSIGILSVPQVDTGMLPWRDLLLRSRYFPMSIDGPTNNDIIEFLNKGARMPADATQIIKQFKGSFVAFLAGDKRNSPKLQRLQKIAKEHQPQWMSYIDEIQRILQALKAPSNDEEKALTLKMHKIIDLLLQNARFFNKLRDLGDRSFKGSQHCKITIASLLVLAASGNGSDLPGNLKAHDLQVTCIIFKILSSLNPYS